MNSVQHQSKISREPLLEPLLRQFRLKRVLKHIPAQTKLLDIGCGTTAAFLRTIASRLDQGIGVDFKVSPIEAGNLKTYQVRLDEKLPFEDDAFDVVTLLAVLEHIEYEQEILKEVERVLKPGGKVILTVPSVWAKPVLEFLAYRLRVVSEAEIRDHKRYYNRQLLDRALVERAGLKGFHHQYFQLWMNNFCIATKA